MEIAACDWVYRNLDRSVDIDACLQTNTPAGLNEV